jgi:hypothetical protein
VLTSKTLGATVAYIIAPGLASNVSVHRHQGKRLREKLAVKIGLTTESIGVMTVMITTSSL